MLNIDLLQCHRRPDTEKYYTSIMGERTLATPLLAMHCRIPLDKSNLTKLQLMYRLRNSFNIFKKAPGAPIFF